jgi:hypothetical protein
MLKKILLTAVIATAFSAVPIAATARPVIITIAPPAPVQEAVPALRRGQQWVPGNHVWRQGRYQWVSGHWVKARAGYSYTSSRWVERNGRWSMEQGRWAPRRGDRDGDGVPNRMDSSPNNPNRN